MNPEPGSHHQSLRPKMHFAIKGWLQSPLAKKGFGAGYWRRWCQLTFIEPKGPAQALALIAKRLALCCTSTLLVVAFGATSGAVAVGAASGTGNLTVKVEGRLASVVACPLTLTPAFDPSITDYVLRCAGGNNTIQVTFNAVRGGSINVNGNRRGAIRIAGEPVREP